MRFLLPLLLVVVAVAAAGCGSSNKSSTPAAENSPADTSSAKSDSGKTEAASDDNLGGDSGDCKHLAELGQKFSKTIGSANPTSASDVKSQIEATAKAFDEFADEAPDAVKGDFRTFATAFAAYADALGGVKLSAGQTPSAADIEKLQAAAQKLNAPDLQKASAHLTAWAQKNCGTAFGTK